jgi:hypothetical protein
MEQLLNYSNDANHLYFFYAIVRFVYFSQEAADQGCRRSEN